MTWNPQIATHQCGRALTVGAGGFVEGLQSEKSIVESDYKSKFTAFQVFRLTFPR